MNKNKMAGLVWICIAGMIISAGIVAIEPNLFVLPMLFGFALGGGTIIYVNILNFKTWRLRRKKTVPASASYRIKKFVKGVRVETSEGHRLTLTSRGVITFFSIIGFLLAGFLCTILKIDNLHTFYVACGAGFLILAMLLGLYFKRRHQGHIEHFRAKPQISKIGMIVFPLIVGGMFASPFTVEAINGDSNNPFDHTTQLEKIGVALFVWIFVGGIVAGLMALKVRQTGFKKLSLGDSFSNIKFKGGNYARGNPFKMRGNFGNSYLDRGNQFKEDNE